MAYSGELKKSEKHFFAGKGFTLVEVIVVIFIFVLMSIAITSLFIGQNSLYQFYTAEVASEGSARRIVNRVTELVRTSESVLSSYDFGGTVHSSGSDTLVLRLPTVDSSDQILTNTFDYVVYYLDPSDNTKLFEKMEADGQSQRGSVTRLLSESIDNVLFTYDNVDFDKVSEVGLAIETLETFKNTVATTTLDILVKLRNRS